MKGSKRMKRKFFAGFAGIVMAVGMIVSGAASAYAQGDITLDCTNAVRSEDWSQSIEFRYDNDAFDASRMTADSIVRVEYELIEEKDSKDPTGYPVELIFQSWSNPEYSQKVDANGAVWGKIAPSSVGEGYEEFTFADIAQGYGTSNFEKVDNMLFGSTNDAVIRITGCTVTNCSDTGSHWVDPSLAEEEKASQRKNIMGVVIGVIAGMLAAVGVTWLIISRQSTQAFDINTGKFIDKRLAK